MDDVHLRTAFMQNTYNVGEHLFDFCCCMVYEWILVQDPFIYYTKYIKVNTFCSVLLVKPQNLWQKQQNAMDSKVILWLTVDWFHIMILLFILNW